MEIAGVTVRPGERLTVDLPLPNLYTHSPMTLPVHVVRGRRDGPSLFVSAAVHGDELNGVEIVRRLLARGVLRRLRGTLIAIPIVNVYGVIHRSRYLPDRRDLNRSFPGSMSGSLAARLAELFVREIITRSTHGIDLHTAAVHRENLPQVRGQLTDAGTLAMAQAFGAPIALDSAMRDGSLRQAAAELGVPTLVYEAGEALRFDEIAIRAGARGIVSVMRSLGMLPARKGRPAPELHVARSSTWVRAPQSGVFRASTPLGVSVERGSVLGIVADPFGASETQVLASATGVVIGRARLPLVHEGEALFHVARFDALGEASESLDSFHDSLEDDLGAGADQRIV